MKGRISTRRVALAVCGGLALAAVVGACAITMRGLGREGWFEGTRTQDRRGVLLFSVSLA